MPHHILTTQRELWDLIKSSAQNKAVHMELSLCLSFSLRHSVGVDTAGTTMGFLVKIVKALAPQPHH
jgi:hypothetical protein